MNYKEFDLILVHKTSIQHKIISKFIKSKWNHCGTVVTSYGELMVSEALSKGVETRLRLEDWIKEQEIKGYQLKFRRPTSIDNKAGQRYNDIKGRGYEFKSLAFFHIVKIVTKKWIGTKNIDKVICSELSAYIRGIKEYWLMTPDDLDKSDLYYDINTK